MAMASGSKPERKLGKRELKTSKKSATLPAGSLPASLMMSHTSEGFFAKIRRCLRLRNRGKYEFNHSSLDANVGRFAVHSTSASSPVGSVHSLEVGSTKSSPHRKSRRSAQDKEEVVLIRKDKPSSGPTLGHHSAGDIGKENLFVISISGVQLEDKNKAVSEPNFSNVSRDVDAADTCEILPEFDPDYETLDSIRNKVRSHVDTSSTVCTQPANDMATDSKGTSAVLTTITDSSQLNGADTGQKSPLTDRSTAVLCKTANQGELPNSLLHAFMINDTSVTLGIDTDPNSSNVAPEEDDLYANSKVLIRKKSQKHSSSNSDVFVSNENRRSIGVCDSRPSSLRNSLSPAELQSIVEASPAEFLAPPPLPERNYSEEDVASLAAGVHLQTACSGAVVESQKLAVSKSKCENENVKSLKENSLKGHTTGARPKTIGHEHEVHISDVTISTTDTAVRDGLNSAVQAGVEMALITQPPLIHAQTTPYHNEKRPCENIYEVIPSRKETSDNCLPVKRDESTESLPFIDADPDPVSFLPASDAPKDLSPDDIMIVSASDSMCRSVEGGSQELAGQSNSGCKQCLVEDIPEVEKPSVVRDDQPHSQIMFIDRCSWKFGSQEMPNPLESQALKVERGEASGMCFEETACELESSVCCAPVKSTHKSCDKTNTKSESQQLSVSSSSSSSSSGTLNYLDNDPDDFERKDLNPPLGPPIHVSHRQLQHQLRNPASNEPSGILNNPDLSEISFGKQAEENASSTSEPHPFSATAADADSKLHQDFLESMRQLKNCGWYWGPLSYEEAENKLLDKHDGSFLVRDSSNENYILSLSFKSMGMVHHTRIEHHKGLFSFWSQPDSHGKAQICQFIEQTIENSKNGRFLYFLRPAGPGSPPLPIQLLYPVSRFCRVPSLQHMCRFLVLKLVRRDHIDSLPLPQKVKAYMLEKQYYVETLEED